MKIHGDHDSATRVRVKSKLFSFYLQITMMMMIREPPQSNPTVHIPPWDYPDPTSHIHSPSSHYDSAILAALHRFLPSNKADDGVARAEDDDNPESDFDFPADAFSCDNFRMFEFKVKKCARARSHDWTECPFAHPGEKARRRDPRRYHYSGSACPDYRRGACGRGDACEYAHGVFECWLHPGRYRTQPCKDGTHCRRRICFFAHTPDQLRVLPYTSSPDGSPRRPELEPFMVFGSNPKSMLSISPPSSPNTGESLKLSQLTETMRGLQLSKMKMGLGLGFGSPRCTSKIRPGFMSLPSTPIRAFAGPGLGPFDSWGISGGEEPAMERVESGKALRERIYAKIGEDNSLSWSDPDLTGPDVGWVSDLVK